MLLLLCCCCCHSCCCSSGRCLCLLLLGYSLCLCVIRTPKRRNSSGIVFVAKNHAHFLSRQEGRHKSVHFFWPQGRSDNNNARFVPPALSRHFLFQPAASNTPLTAFLPPYYSLLLRAVLLWCQIYCVKQEELAEGQEGMLALQEALERAVDAARGLLERAQAAAAEAEGGEVSEHASTQKLLCRGPVCFCAGR